MALSSLGIAAPLVGIEAPVETLCLLSPVLCMWIQTVLLECQSRDQESWWEEEWS